uniref:Thioesterase domain-containing protein n=1 Tax=Chrysotila carterae TaxID=13221 RepID=A0A7S4C181_CHRCT|mmetsp:Transcript_27194/g.59732  ORF Transcript_27194/g.59732 Transcript_27194/m.59732 type:complete len:338 (-) Transcript_27194:133-1146(-)
MSTSMKVLHGLSMLLQAASSMVITTHPFALSKCARACPVARIGQNRNPKARAFSGLHMLSLPPTGTMGITVFIEDTDAFGIVYNANYLRFLERAVHGLLGLSRCGQIYRATGRLLRLESLEKVKFVSPAMLGDDLRVDISVLGLDPTDRLHVRASVRREADKQELWSCESATLSFRSGLESTPAWPASLPRPGPSDASEALSRAEDEADGQRVLAEMNEMCQTESAASSVSVQSDECDALGMISLHSALRYFERQRSNCIGGPLALARLQQDGIQVVVGRISETHLFSGLGGGHFGDKLAVRCGIVIRAKHTQVVFDQWLFCEASGRFEYRTQPAIK